MSNCQPPPQAHVPFQVFIRKISISWWEFLNVWRIVDCVTQSLNHPQCLCLFVFNIVALLVLLSLILMITCQKGYMCTTDLQCSEDGKFKSGSLTDWLAEWPGHLLKSSHLNNISFLPIYNKLTLMMSILDVLSSSPSNRKQSTKFRGEIDDPNICLTRFKLNMDFQYISSIFLDCSVVKGKKRGGGGILAVFVRRGVTNLDCVPLRPLPCTPTLFVIVLPKKCEKRKYRVIFYSPPHPPNPPK